MATPQRNSQAQDERSPGQSSVERLSSPNEPNPLHVNRMLWILLGLSVVFLVGVQMYVGRVEKATAAEQAQLPDVAILQTYGPVEAIRANGLWLSWGATVGASNYALRIHTLRGAPVVDPMMVYGNEWRPSDAILPGLTSGTYRWTVDAMDASGQKLATSSSREFTIK